MTTPSVSILTTVYNREKYLAAFIDTVLGSTDKVRKLIFVDDVNSYIPNYGNQSIFNLLTKYNKIKVFETLIIKKIVLKLIIKIAAQSNFI
jgi:hypothetical protein